MLALYIKTFGKEFYLQHTGLLLFIFYIIFGAVEPSQMIIYHLTLIICICSSPIILSIFLILLTLYTLKCYLFIKQKLALPIYQFINVSCGTDKNSQIKNWFALYGVISQPPLIYIALLVYAGFKYSYYWSVLIIMAYYIILLLAAAFFTYRAINLKYVSRKNIVTIDLPKVNKPYWSWSLYYIMQSQTIMVIVCKILSFILFNGIIWMFADADKDMRVYLIAMLATVITHSVLISTVLKYERTQLTFVTSLPVSSGQKMLTRLLFFSILFLPELMFYLSYSSNNLDFILTGILFCISGALTIYMSLYFFDNNMNLQPSFMFSFFIVAILVILYKQTLFFSLFLLLITMSYHQYLFHKSKL